MTFSLQSIMILFLIIVAHSSTALAVSAPRIIVSIKPLHSLVTQVTGDVATPILLVDGTTSPHEFQMKPSHMSELEQADMVIYLDEHYEKFLHHALESLPKSVESLALIDAANIALLPIRGAGTFEQHDHDHDHHADDDYHVWLNPVHAQTMVKTIATALAKRYPEHQKSFEKNAAHTIEELQKIDADLATQLKPLSKTPFILFHDATQYFEQRYGLQAAGSITLEPNESASWKRIDSIRKKIARTNTRCIFTEPYFSDKQLRPIVSGAKHPIHRGIIDPEGTALKAGASLYKTLMNDMAKSFATCLD